MHLTAHAPAAAPLHQHLDGLIYQARAAQQVFESFDQAQVDAIVKDFGRYVYDHARPLSELAVQETGIGVLEDKVAKKIGKSRAIWNSLKHAPSRGIIGEDHDRQLLLVAKPMGVVGAVTPVTNPVVTPMCNAMFALKAGNAVIFAPHPKAQRCAEHLTEAYRKILVRHGAPADLVQTVRGADVPMTQALMRQVDVVIATGGSAMVKAAYSSGRPSLGVGAGNVQVIIDRDVDLPAALGKIVAGAAFDNGIICSHEQFVLVHRDDLPAAEAALRAMDHVCYLEDNAAADAIRQVLFVEGKINREVVGRSCAHIGGLAGLAIPERTRVIALRARGVAGQDIIAREKLCPVIGLLPYATFEEAVALAKANLLLEGAGHTAGLHSDNATRIAYAGIHLPVSRLVVNQTCSTSAGGSLTNGLAPTTTLGCGSWGNNSISENLDFKHLMNISRIAKVITHRAPVTDEQIWN